MSEESALWYSSLDGLSLFARRFGAPSRRAPLLCLHDVARTSRSIVPLAQEIAPYRRVLIPDIRGHGRSDYPFDLRSYSIKTLADDAAQLLKTEEITKAVVLGCGLGSIVGLQLTAHQPDAVVALILCEPGCELASLPEAISRNDEEVMRDDWDPVAAPSLARSLVATNCPSLLEQCRGKPILALRGANSLRAGADALKAMAHCNGDLELLSIAGISDARRFDRPEILKPIKAFLANLA